MVLISEWMYLLQTERSINRGISGFAVGNLLRPLRFMQEENKKEQSREHQQHRQKDFFSETATNATTQLSLLFNNFTWTASVTVEEIRIGVSLEITV